MPVPPPPTPPTVSTARTALLQRGTAQALIYCLTVVIHNIFALSGEGIDRGECLFLGGISALTKRLGVKEGAMDPQSLLINTYTNVPIVSMNNLAQLFPKDAEPSTCASLVFSSFCAQLVYLFIVNGRALSKNSEKAIFCVLILLSARIIAFLVSRTLVCEIVSSISSCFL